MLRLRTLFLGPEGLWLLIISMSYLAAMSNRPATPAGNEWLEALWTSIPLIGIPLTFLTAYLSGGGGWRWLLRIVVGSIVGILIASTMAASGVDYQDSRNSGLMTVPFYSLAIGLLLLIPCTLIAAGIIWKKSRQAMRTA